MKIIFLGVGEAFDENLPNNSQLIITEKTKLLLDCGFTVPPQVWKYNPDPNFLDAINISHLHSDHYFGLFPLLVRMWEDGREKDLTIICQKELEESFKTFMNLGYKDFQERFKYKVNLIESEKNKIIKFNDLELFFAKTIHSRENLAVKISDGKNTIAYTGDGAPVESDFYKNLNLLIIETYLYNEEKIGHSSVISAIEFAEKNDIKCLALTHMNRNFRKNELPKMKDKIKSDKIKIIIPEPLDEYSL